MWMNFDVPLVTRSCGGKPVRDHVEIASPQATATFYGKRLQFCSSFSAAGVNNRSSSEPWAWITWWIVFLPNELNWTDLRSSIMLTQRSSFFYYYRIQLLQRPVSLNPSGVQLEFFLALRVVKGPLHGFQTILLWSPHKMTYLELTSNLNSLAPSRCCNQQPMTSLILRSHSQKRLGTTGVVFAIQIPRLFKNLPGPLTAYNTSSQVLIHLMGLEWKPVATLSPEDLGVLCLSRERHWQCQSCGLHSHSGQSNALPLPEFEVHSLSCALLRVSHVRVWGSSFVFVFVLMPNHCLCELGLIYMALMVSV